MPATRSFFAAGTGALYSNFGFDMLALGLADAAGKPYEALLSERVLEPMGLNDTGLSVAPGRPRFA